MGVHNSIDVPGGVKFFEGHGPAPVLGDCPHDCNHRSLAVIAWGPDWARYELIRCNAECGGTCRGWKRVESYDDRGVIDRWLHVGDETPLHGMDRVVVAAR